MGLFIMKIIGKKYRVDLHCNLLILLLDHLEDFGLTSIDDGNDRGAEVLTAGCAKIYVIAIEWEDIAAGEHSVVFDEGTVSWGNIRSEDDELGLTIAEGLECLGNTEGVLAGLCDKGEGVDDGFASAR